MNISDKKSNKKLVKKKPTKSTRTDINQLGKLITDKATKDVHHKK